ncbi:DNA-processing protein DprA [Deferribacter thermophilus]|uniref:DNA-processing protein DprA n=1 Tax=Deferribacter thermophilus TaxID=53573 RepID=UPI003C244C59
MESNRKLLLKNYLLLKSIKGISDNIIVNLIKKYGSLFDIFERDFEELKTDFGEKIATLIKHSFLNYESVNNEIELINKYKAKMLLYEDDNYPELLKRISNPPAFLYCFGDISVLDKPMIAVVGSRRASKRGLRFAERLGMDLAEVGINVVSGFAAGIDIAVHIGAMKKGVTTAVLGNGLRYIYPESNKKYFKDIVNKGCVLTEFSINTKPDPYNFPRRNRIIAGLSYGVVVVEAAEKSGSLITARLAMEENREVYAVPMWPEEKNRGANKLLREGAKLLESYYDVLEDIVKYVDNIKIIDKEENKTNINFEDALEEKIYNALSLSPKNIDELCLSLDIDYVTIMNKISMMELKGFVYSEYDGKYYVRSN